MKTVRRKFQPEFWDAVRSGAKLHTIRPFPRYTPAPGDIFVAEGWQGTPYRSKVIELARGVISRPCESVTLYFNFTDGLLKISRDGLWQKPEEVEAFAVSDGFPSSAAMRDWFIARYRNTAEFTGALIHWKLEGGAP